MAINIIVAVARNRVIGKNNSLPWYLPADLRHFKNITSGHTVIVGRKTYESIIARLGHPLPDRQTIVVTSQKLKPHTNLITAPSLPDALVTAQSKEVFIIGGAQIYNQALDISDRIYLTKVETEIKDGDAFFPEINKTMWQQISTERHPADVTNPYAYTFITLERV